METQPQPLEQKASARSSADVKEARGGVETQHRPHQQKPGVRSSAEVKEAQGGMETQPQPLEQKASARSSADEARGGVETQHRPHQQKPGIRSKKKRCEVETQDRHQKHEPCVKNGATVEEQKPGVERDAMVKRMQCEGRKSLTGSVNMDKTKVDIKNKKDQIRSIIMSERETGAEWQRSIEPHDDPALQGQKDPAQGFDIKVPRGLQDCCNLSGPYPGKAAGATHTASAYTLTLPTRDLAHQGPTAGRASTSTPSPPYHPPSIPRHSREEATQLSVALPSATGSQGPSLAAPGQTSLLTHNQPLTHLTHNQRQTHPTHNQPLIHPTQKHRRFERAEPKDDTSISAPEGGEVKSGRVVHGEAKSEDTLMAAFDLSSGTSALTEGSFQDQTTAGGVFIFRRPDRSRQIGNANHVPTSDHLGSDLLDKRVRYSTEAKEAQEGAEGLHGLKTKEGGGEAKSGRVQGKAKSEDMLMAVFDLSSGTSALTEGSFQDQTIAVFRRPDSDPGGGTLDIYGLKTKDGGGEVKSGRVHGKDKSEDMLMAAFDLSRGTCALTKGSSQDRTTAAGVFIFRRPDSDHSGSDLLDKAEAMHLTQQQRQNLGGGTFNSSSRKNKEGGGEVKSGLVHGRDKSEDKRMAGFDPGGGTSALTEDSYQDQPDGVG
jgi:hypothetical protein